jgi:ABC-type glycerol-3-phosphate transport system substrate-binding protein
MLAAMILSASGAAWAQSKAVSGNLRILYPGTSEFEKKMALVWQDEVQKKYPNIKMEFIFLVWSDLEKKLAVMVQAHDYPDIMMVQDVTNPVSMDALEVLDPYFNDQMKLSSFYSAPLDYMKVGGKIYAVPFLAIVYSHVANKEKLTAAGVNLDTIKTWDDMRAAVKALNKGGTAGYAMANGGTGRFTFRDFMMVSLSDGFSPDDVSAGSKTKYIETLKLFADMAPYMPKSQVTWLYPELFKSFDNGGHAIMHTGSYFTANIIANGTKGLKSAVLFAFPKGPSASKPQVMVGANGFAILKGSKQKDAAWKAIEVAMSPAVLGPYAGAMNISAVDYITDDMMEAGAKSAYPDGWKEHLALSNSFRKLVAAYGVPMPKILGQPQMEIVLQAAIIKMLDGKATPEQTYDEIKKGIDQIKSTL